MKLLPVKMENSTLMIMTRIGLTSSQIKECLYWADVDISDVVKVDKQEYSVIGTISHIGNDATEGHNRAYLKQGRRWFLCEDSKLPKEKCPIDTESEQNYCFLLRKCEIGSIEAKRSSVAFKQLSMMDLCQIL